MVGGSAHSCTSMSHASCRGHLESLLEPVPVPTPNQRVNADPLRLSLRRRSAHQWPEPVLQGLHPLSTDSLGISPLFLEPQDFLGSSVSHIVMWSVFAQPAVELHPGWRCQGPGTSTTVQQEPDQPRVSGASMQAMGRAGESESLVPTRRSWAVDSVHALSTQSPLT